MLWNSLNDAQNGGVAFEELEIDFYAYIQSVGFNWSGVSSHFSTSNQLVYSTKPLKPKGVSPTKKPGADYYVLFEITLDPKLYKKKILQLERILAWILAKHKCPPEKTNKILKLVAFCGLVTTKNVINEIAQFVASTPEALPICSYLLQCGRLVVLEYKGKSNQQNFVLTLLY